MRRLVVLMITFVAACAGAPQGRAPLVAPLELDEPTVAVERRVPADADRAPPSQPRAPGDAAPSGPVYRSVVETVEAPRFDGGQPGSTSGADPVYVEYARSEDGRRDKPSPFPINTAIGAGVGAIIGHQSGHRDTGALVGAGVGLMLDLQRWLR